MSAADLKEMMENWNKTEDAARAAHPGATSEEIYQIAAAAMSKSLGLGDA